MAEIDPVHPGEVLMEEFLEPLGVTQHRLAVEIGVPPRRINEIVHGKRRVTAGPGTRPGAPRGRFRDARRRQTAASRMASSGRRPGQGRPRLP